MMKQIIPFLFFILLLNGNVFAQYRPLLAEGNEWHVYQQIEFGVQLFDWYTVTTDTLLDEQIYKTIEVVTCNFEECDFKRPAHFLREDTLTKKVYRYVKNSPSRTEELLYDFSLMPGDTFLINNGEMVLDSITDYVDNRLDCFGAEPEFGIDSLKVFYFNSTNTASLNTIWIEGIGSLTGILDPDFSWVGGFSGVTLLCHNKGSGENVFFYNYCNAFDDPCDLVVATQEPAHKWNIQIYPNPVKEQLFIQLPEPLTGSTIKIYSLQGKEALVTTDVSIDMAAFPQGIYIIAVFQEGQLVGSHKVVRE